MGLRIDSARRKIFRALSQGESLSWTELLEKTGVSKGALSQNVNELLENKIIMAELDLSRPRRTTVYSLSENGKYEERKLRMVDFISSLKNPVIYESKQNNITVSVLGNLISDLDSEERVKLEGQIEKEIGPGLSELTSFLEIFFGLLSENKGYNKVAITFQYEL